jgi:lycopene cyclase domain-containing protein
MMWLYLICLCISLGCLALIDRRYKLAFWFERRRTVMTIVSAVMVFVIWDILGIMLGVFFHGNSQLTLPLRLFPEFPVEEVFFLTLLCYVTLLLHRGWTKQ